MEVEGVFGTEMLFLMSPCLVFFWCISLGIFLSLSYASDLYKAILVVTLKILVLLHGGKAFQCNHFKELYLTSISFLKKYVVI